MSNFRGLFKKANPPMASTPYTQFVDPASLRCYIAMFVYAKQITLGLRDFFRKEPERPDIASIAASAHAAIDSFIVSGMEYSDTIQVGALRLRLNRLSEGVRLLTPSRRCCRRWNRSPSSRAISTSAVRRSHHEPRASLTPTRWPRRRLRRLRA